MRPPTLNFDELHVRGMAMLPFQLGSADLAQYLDLFDHACAREHVGIRKSDQVYAIRNLLDLAPEIGDLVARSELGSFIRAELPPRTRLVKAIFFDKPEAANWRVRWHQDVTIAVRERVEAAGFHGWSKKAGIDHVRATREVLEHVFTLRLLLDDCPSTAGPLRVILGSHRQGLLDDAQIASIAHSGTVAECVGPQGSIAILRPLLVHASASTQDAKHRRVLHLELSAQALAPPLAWRWALPIP